MIMYSDPLAFFGCVEYFRSKRFRGFLRHYYFVSHRKIEFSHSLPRQNSVFRHYNYVLSFKISKTTRPWACAQFALFPLRRLWTRDSFESSIYIRTEISQSRNIDFVSVLVEKTPKLSNIYLIFCMNRL